MTNTSTPKKYPSSTAEVAKMLGINSIDHSIPLASFSAEHNLPVAQAEEKVLGLKPSADPAALESLEEKEKKQSTAFKVAKAAAPYVVVFGAGLFLYYFFFSNVNFTNIFKSAPKVETPKETALQTLEKQDLSAYNAWISDFYFDVSDPKILDPETDNSGNGLNNFQKYLLNLNPRAYDTLGIGMADSQAISKGINPLTGGNLTDKQKDLISKYVDLEVAQNRLVLYNLQNPGRVAGAEIGGQSFPLNNGQAFANSLTGNTTGYVSPNTGSNASQVLINTDTPGLLEIPQLKIKVPIIWSADPKNFDKDLQVGVVHYPGTALPGEIGTTYISGHSSNYIWAKGNYNQIFAKLGDLPENTSFKITVVQQNGRDAIFHYVVNGRKEYLPTDQEQFKNTGKSTVALSTCWPVGSTAKRLVVFGTLTQVEK